MKLQVTLTKCLLKNFLKTFKNFSQKFYKNYIALPNYPPHIKYRKYKTYAISHNYESKRQMQINANKRKWAKLRKKEEKEVKKLEKLNQKLGRSQIKSMRRVERGESWLLRVHSLRQVETQDILVENIF